ncbi:hypothetical protein [Streptobacillus moniliformis]|uniref:hypothetical protein n=1 Tax=Streptobacillus moniliformis TaxID=34105 RepID=UPI0007E38CE2|nr:hypothetical protein [Streptobacillus moniliformis]
MKKLFTVMVVLLALVSCGSKEDEKIDEIVKDGIYTREEIIEFRNKLNISLEDIAKDSKFRKKTLENLEKYKQELDEEVKNIKLGESFVGSVNGDR